MVTESVIAVRYPETDPMDIVHHAVYPLWYEIGRMDWCAAVGFPYTDMQALGINPTMVSLNLTYKAPVTYPGSVTVRTRCAAFGPRKLELHYETLRGDGVLVNTAVTFHLWTGPDNRILNLAQAQPAIYARLCEAAGPALETLT